MWIFKTLVALTGEPEPAPAQPDHHRPVPGFDEARFTIAALPVVVLAAA